ncbi:hypothetical protein MtrunA17_Chr5g0433251 [Medicago truncatula]|uniref:Uncharacterized protein n=1 Tax=Medicago truncatula TaxID=3880 RepID=A0A396HTY8_MEDTR|nr:hypothetical protein MtrunA17_Chr5g0433251 [Medicago truncatula]
MKSTVEDEETFSYVSNVWSLMRIRRGLCCFEGNKDKAWRTRSRAAISTKTSLDSQWRRMLEMIRASRRVLMLLRIAPVKGTAKWSSYMAGMLGAMTETTLPRRIPKEVMAEASWRHRLWV